MEKKILLISTLLLFVCISFVFSESVYNANQIVTLAVAENQLLSVRQYNKLTIELEGEDYTLDVLKVHRDRRKADFVLKSDQSKGIDYIQYYFTLNIGPSSLASISEESKQVYYRTEKSKTIPLGDDTEFYIELVSIRSRKANIIMNGVLK